jgi:glutathione S-transferase
MSPVNFGGSPMETRRDLMRVVYGFKPSPFVRKVRVVLAEKGLPYEFEPATPLNPYGFGPFEVDAEFMKISPLGKIPAYRDGDVTLSDSSVICAYLERAHPEPPLYPADAHDYARALWFEEYGDTALAGVLAAKIGVPKLLGARFTNQPPDEAAIQRAVTQDLPPLFEYLESQLTDGETIIGSRFSIGDIGVATQFVSLRYAGVGLDETRWPKLTNYIESVLARPSFRATMEDEIATIGSSSSSHPLRI